MRVVAFLPILLALCACNTTGAGTGSVADPPSLENIKATIRANKTNLWKDPDSVRDVSLSDAWRYMAGWKLCMRSNAKNSFGGYTGITTHTVWIHDNGGPPIAKAAEIYDGCDSQSYWTFPDIEKGYQPPAPAAQPKTPKR